MSNRNGKVTVTNRELAAAQKALRECGSTRIPMGVALRMVSVQRLIKDRIDDVNEINKGLVEEHGTPPEGREVATEVSDEMPGFQPYLDAFGELMDEKFSIPDHFILYQKDDKYGWTENVKTPIALTPNAIVDMGDLLEIKAPPNPKPRARKKKNAEPDMGKPEPVPE